MARRKVFRAKHGLTSAQRKAIRMRPLSEYRKVGFRSYREVEKRILELQQERRGWRPEKQPLGRPKDWVTDPATGRLVRKVKIKTRKVRVLVRHTPGIPKPKKIAYHFAASLPGGSPFATLYFTVKSRYIDEATTKALKRAKKRLGRKVHLTLMSTGKPHG